MKLVGLNCEIINVKIKTLPLFSKNLKHIKNIKLFKNNIRNIYNKKDDQDDMCK
jgi:hypothetical protein